jgi:hypothetical protein
MNYRYQNIDIKKKNGIGNQFYTNNLYPNIPLSNDDNYVISVLGDRMDLLAFDFYGDSSLWWVIASANSLSGDSLYLEPGMQIRIPINVVGVINQYNSINVIR